MGTMISTGEPTRMSATQRKVVLWILDNTLYVATIFIFIFFSFVAAEQNFLTFGNMVNILISAAVLGLIACGLTITMLAGQIDQSQTGVAALATIATGVIFMWWVWPAPAAILAVLAIGALAGLVTSVLIVNARIYSLIATLSIVGLYIGIAMGMCNNLQIPLARLELQQLLLYRGIGGIPLTVWAMIIFYLIAYIMLNHTKLGSHIYATGANYNAARLCGVPVNRVIRITLMVSGVCVALAAALVTARGGITQMYGSAVGIQGGDAFIAVLLGGVSLFGGSGKIERNLVAVFFLAILANGLNLLNVGIGGWYMARGVAFIVAVILDVMRVRFSQNT